MKQLKKTVSMSLDENIINKTKILAQNSGRSVSRYINWVLRRHLAEVCKTEPLENNQQQKQ